MFKFKESDKARIVRAYRSTFSTDEGKQVLYDLAKSCHVYHSTMDPNPHEMAYKEGERSVVLRIMRTLNINPFELERAMKSAEEN